MVSVLPFKPASLRLVFLTPIASENIKALMPQQLLPVKRPIRKDCNYKLVLFILRQNASEIVQYPQSSDLNT